MQVGETFLFHKAWFDGLKKERSVGTRVISLRNARLSYIYSKISACNFVLQKKPSTYCTSYQRVPLEVGGIYPGKYFLFPRNDEPG